MNIYLNISQPASCAILYQNLLYNINTFNYIYFELLKEGNINLSFERVKYLLLIYHSFLNNINLPTYRPTENKPDYSSL